MDSNHINWIFSPVHTPCLPKFLNSCGEQDSNLRPLGYEPNELPLLHPAMSFCCFITIYPIISYLIFEYFFFIHRIKFNVQSVEQDSNLRNNSFADCFFKPLRHPHMKKILFNHPIRQEKREQVKGIEPSSEDWKSPTLTVVLYLHFLQKTYYFIPQIKLIELL